MSIYGRRRPRRKSPTSRRAPGGSDKRGTSDNSREPKPENPVWLANVAEAHDLLLNGTLRAELVGIYSRFVIDAAEEWIKYGRTGRRRK